MILEQGLPCPAPSLVTKYSREHPATRRSNCSGNIRVSNTRACVPAGITLTFRHVGFEYLRKGAMPFMGLGALESLRTVACWRSRVAWTLKEGVWMMSRHSQRRCTQFFAFRALHLVT